MLAAHLRLRVGVAFVRPATENLLTQLAQFLDHTLFGGVGVGAVGDGLIECVEEVVQAGQQLRPVRQTFFKNTVSFGKAQGRCRFIVHQPLC